MERRILPSDEQIREWNKRAFVSQFVDPVFEASQVIDDPDSPPDEKQQHLNNLTTIRRIALNMGLDPVRALQDALLEHEKIHKKGDEAK